MQYYKTHVQGLYRIFQIKQKLKLPKLGLQKKYKTSTVFWYES